MRYVRTTDATVEPVTIAEAMQHLLVENTEDQAYIGGLIKKARLSVERRFSRQLVTATWKAYADDFPPCIELRITPVIAVSAITYTDTGGTTQTLAASSYQVDAACPNQPGRILPAYGCSWPSIRGDTLNAVCVTFTAGYGATAAAVPEDVKHWILATVGHWYRFREPVITGTIATEIPGYLDNLLVALDWGNYS